MTAALFSATQALDQVQEEPTASTSVSGWFTPSTVGTTVLILVLISGYFIRRKMSNDSRAGALPTNGSDGPQSNDQSGWPLEGVTVLPRDVVNPAPISPTSLPLRPPLAYHPSKACRHSPTMPVSRTQQRLATPERASSASSQIQSDGGSPSPLNSGDNVSQLAMACNTIIQQGVGL